MCVFDVCLFYSWGEQCQCFVFSEFVGEMILFLIINVVLFVWVSLVIIFFWLGVMSFIVQGDLVMMNWIFGYVFLFGLLLQVVLVVKVIGVYQVVMVCLIGVLLFSGSFCWIGFIMLGIYCVFVLMVFLINFVWIEEVGGFFVIGFGQGILKYLGILGFVMWVGSFDCLCMFFSWYSDFCCWS